MREYQTELGKVILGDAYELLKSLPRESADLIILDPPYIDLRDARTEKAKNWRVVRSYLTKVLKRSARVIKQNQPVVLFGYPSFFVKLGKVIDDNFRVYFDVVWKKPTPTNPLSAKLHPLVVHEQILFLVRKDAKVSKMTYNYLDIGTYGNPPLKCGGGLIKRFGNVKRIRRVPPDFRHPTTVVEFNHLKNRHGHPTEKPVELMEWLVKGWTNKGDFVADPFLGSGSTAVACERLGRRWIGTEISEEYFNIIVERLKTEVGGG